MPPMSTNLMAPAVSFRTDVMKVLDNNCGSSACHGRAQDPTGGVFLGDSTAKGQDADAVYAAIVGQRSGELEGMKLVTPGDPANSYLMHKLDGDQCQFDTSCTGQDCQHSMPSGETVVLAVPLRDTVRRWIAQGALSQ
jgi:hypothetical protein